MCLTIVASVLLQYVAVALSLRLVPLTRHRAPWILLAAGMLLMAVRQMLHLHDVLLAPGTSPEHTWPSELLALSTSLLVVVGLARIRPLFAELRRHEERLGHEVRRLKTILDSLGEPAYVVEPVGHQVLFANLPAKAAFGPVVGSRCYRALYGRTSPCDPCGCTPAAGTSSQATREWQMHNGDSGRWYHMVNRTIEWSDGRIACLELSYDITERRLHEQELADSSRRLEKANLTLAAKQKELEEFLYMVSHDMKTPIITVGGFARLLTEQCGAQLGQRGHHYLERIVENARCMEAFLQDLLELSRIGRTDDAVEEIDTLEVVRAVLADHEPAAAERGIGLRLSGGLPRVRGNRRRLHQLFTNLVDNAIKYMPPRPDPWVEIGYAKTLPAGIAADGAFYVRDNGSGLPPEEQDQVFRMFYRTRSGSAQAPGSGVGLAIVKRIVTTHGGHIWLRSAPGLGAAFYFELPLAQASVADPPVDEPLSMGLQ
jgi:signal transduction histidine kinase